MRCIFMGTPDFAVSVLDALEREGHEIFLVITQPDKPSGRKGGIAESPVKIWAKERDLPIYQPENIRSKEAIEMIRDFPIDIGIVAAYGQIIPPEILDVPTFGYINVHASLLPKYRGASPIQWSIINGDDKTGITIMQMGPGLDDGDIIMQEEVDIADDETGESLFDKLAVMGGNMCCMAMVAISNSIVTPIKQDESKATYVSVIKKDFGAIDFTNEASHIERMTRALDPWPSAFTYWKGQMLKIYKAKVVTEEEIVEAGDLLGGSMAMESMPGTVVFTDPYQILIRCGYGFLAVTDLQLAGKRRMDVGDFLNGNHIEIGTMLGI